MTEQAGKNGIVEKIVDHLTAIVEDADIVGLGTDTHPDWGKYRDVASATFLLFVTKQVDTVNRKLFVKALTDCFGEQVIDEKVTHTPARHKVAPCIDKINAFLASDIEL